MTRTNIPCVVSIAGTDPSGGAGIQADLKAISATGSYAASIITALVAQNTQGVRAIYPIPTDFVQQQIDAVFDDLDIKAVKIGMLFEAAMIEQIASALETLKPPHIVFDPVMVAKDGSVLLDLSTIAFLKQRFLPLTHLITPNRFEAEQLLGTPINTLDDMVEAARALSLEYKLHVLLKGGHFDGEESADLLYNHQTHEVRWYRAPRINTKNTHGTGCSLSSAIASYLAQGLALEEACDAAKEYITQAILSGRDLGVGKGQGPVDHFYFLTSSFTPRVGEH